MNLPVILNLGEQVFSSIIAKAVKKTFSEIGTLDPNKDKTPKEKAISVADGIAQPLRVSGVWKFI